MKKLANKIEDTLNNIFSFSKGFTLLELLVIVLIIGILASIALPQYRKAKEKSNIAPILSILKNLYQAEESYYLVHRSYSKKFNNLNVDFNWPNTSNYWYPSTWVKDRRERGEWIMEIIDDNYALLISAGRKSGKYKGTGFQIVLSPKDNRLKRGNLYCSEYVGAKYGFPSKEYCPKIFKTSTGSSYPGANRMYILRKF